MLVQNIYAERLKICHIYIIKKGFKCKGIKANNMHQVHRKQCFKVIKVKGAKYDISLVFWFLLHDAIDSRACEGVGGSQFQRQEKKPRNLSTLQRSPLTMDKYIDYLILIDLLQVDKHY